MSEIISHVATEKSSEKSFGVVFSIVFDKSVKSYWMQRREAIVCTPQDAFKCFMGTELDLLVVGNCVLRKDQQDKSLTEDYKEKYALD